MVGMQEVLDVGLIPFFAKREVFDMMNGVDCVIPSFNIAGSIGLSEFSKPIYMRCHVI